MKLLIINDYENLITNEFDKVLNIKDINSCTGCVSCWFKTPGKCIVPDHAQNYGRRLTEYNDITIVSNSEFATFPYQIKNIIDRSISYLGTFMISDANDVRHEKRYEHNFKLNIVFYGDINKEEKKALEEQVKAMCKNFFIESHRLSFYTNKEKAYNKLNIKVNKSSSDIESNLMLDKNNNSLSSYQIAKQGYTKNNKIAIINASPRLEKSVSRFYIDKLIENYDLIREANINPTNENFVYKNSIGTNDKNNCLESSEKIDVFNWSSSIHLSKNDIAKLLCYNSIVICFGLYVDNMPSSCLRALHQIKSYIIEYKKLLKDSDLKLYDDFVKYLKSTRVFAMANNGLIHGFESCHAIKSCQHFANDSGMSWITGLAIGSGPLYTNSKSGIYNSKDAETIRLAINQLSRYLNSKKTTSLDNIYTNGHLDNISYRDLLNSIWQKNLDKYKK